MIDVNGNYTYKFIIPQKLGDNIQNTSGKVTVSFMLTEAGNNFVKVYGSCMPSQIVNLENRFWYFGYWSNGQVGQGNFVPYLLPVNSSSSPAIFIPNLVNTASSNPETNTFKAFSANGYGYSAFWYRTEIYNRWGDRVFVKEETAEHPTIDLHNRFADNSWIGWDGKMNGQWVADATFVWYINMENCPVPRKQQGNLPQEWSDDVNVFRRF